MFNPLWSTGSWPERGRKIAQGGTLEVQAPPRCCPFFAHVGLLGLWEVAGLSPKSLKSVSYLQRRAELVGGDS